MIASEYYDGIYLSVQHYRGPPEASPYHPLWNGIIELLPDSGKILDVGCGPGQFGELCVKNGYKYVGLDYSAVAIKLARNKGYGTYYHRNVQLDQEFIKQGKYDILTAIEFFEHVHKDKEIISTIPSGRYVIITGPNYGDVSHVRFFTSLDEMTRRYLPLIDIDMRMTLSGKSVVGETSQIYVIRGRKK